jgi:hypothetical protein
MVPGGKDEVLLHMDKSVDWNGRTNHAFTCVAGALAYILTVLYVPIHPFLLALIAVLLALGVYRLVGRITAMGPESITITKGKVVVVKDRERSYLIGPSTKVHLDVRKRTVTERIGPLKEISFESRREGIAMLSVANGWTEEQVRDVFGVIGPLVEPKEIKATIRFKRYLATDLK